jgi:hypothetical protein
VEIKWIKHIAKETFIVLKERKPVIAGRSLATPKSQRDAKSVQNVVVIGIKVIVLIVVTM